MYIGVIFTGVLYHCHVDLFDDMNRNTILIENVSSISPDVIFLRPPEKLVIELKATGRYLRIAWQKNGAVLSANTPQSPNEFPNHYEIYVVGETTEDDFGLYEVNLFPFDITGQLAVPGDLDFVVIPPCKLFLFTAQCSECTCLPITCS